MERKDPELLSDILRNAIEETMTHRRFDEITAIQLWPSVIGRELAEKSPRPVVKNGVMTIRIFSAPLRQELNMRRSSLAAALNKAVGKDVIKEIKFTG